MGRRTKKGAGDKAPTSAVNGDGGGSCAGLANSRWSADKGVLCKGSAHTA